MMGKSFTVIWGNAEARAEIERRLWSDIEVLFGRVLDSPHGVRESWTGWHERQASHILKDRRPCVRRPDASKISNTARRRPTVFYRSVRSWR